MVDDLKFGFLNYGFVVPFGDAADVAELAALGEEHGWDALFVAEGVWGVDAWVTLTAAALATRRLRVGTLLTPVPRVKPWDLASRVGTLDRLSNGRVVLGAGLGALHDGWTAFERDEGRATRVKKLEEGLAIYDGLMRGQPFSYRGEMYQVSPTTFGVPDPPVQKPRPPVWLVGAYVPGREKQPSLARAARWDGLLPQRVNRDEPPAEVPGEVKPQSPDDLAEIVTRVRAFREAAGLPWAGYDVVLEADTTGEFVKLATLDKRAWVDVGVTWWVESWWSLENTAGGRAELRRRIEAGPPGS
jgi:Luciferase-like monooxygenase